MLVVVFKITLRPDIDAAEYEKTGTRMAELVSEMPGFLGMDYAAIESGELLIARFESPEALEAWRTHAEHLAAQQQGRERFFSAYRIEICELVRSYGFQADV
jgi:heme-degrading monooxygenase HmoA